MQRDSAQDLHHLWLLGSAVVAGGLLYLLAPILAPFVLAAVLAYICNPLVGRLERRRVPRTVGTLLVMLLLAGLFLLLLLILLPVLSKEVALLVERIPGFVARLNTELAPWLRERFGVELQLDPATIRRVLTEQLQGREELAVSVLASLRVGGLAVIGFLVTSLLVPVVLFYVLRDWPRLVAHVDVLIPRRWHARVGGLAREVDGVLAEFLRGQLSVMLIMSAFYSAALWVAGLEFALPIGILTGMLVFVPYLGSVIGIVLATLAALMQFPTAGGVIGVWVAIGIGQALEGMLITPWLVGERIGLHPVAVIFALLAFGQLFGFFGVLVALPASAVLLVWLRHVRAGYLDSGLYRG